MKVEKLPAKRQFIGRCGLFDRDTFRKIARHIDIVS